MLSAALVIVAPLLMVMLPLSVAVPVASGLVVALMYLETMKLAKLEKIEKTTEELKPAQPPGQGTGAYAARRSPDQNRGPN